MPLYNIAGPSYTASSSGSCSELLCPSACQFCELGVLPLFQKTLIMCFIIYIRKYK